MDIGRPLWNQKEQREGEKQLTITTYLKATAEYSWKSIFEFSQIYEHDSLPPFFCQGQLSFPEKSLAYAKSMEYNHQERQQTEMS
jgi:hypothetical protein